MKCKICNREFKNYIGLGVHIKTKHSILLVDYYDKYLKKYEYEGICKFCGSRTTFKGLVKGYADYCSLYCSNNDIEVKNKKIDSYVKMYGVDSPMKSEEIKSRTCDTCINRYGVSHPSKSEEVKKKVVDSWLDVYGVSNPSKLEEVKRKKTETSMKN